MLTFRYGVRITNIATALDPSIRMMLVVTTKQPVGAAVCSHYVKPDAGVRAGKRETEPTVAARRFETMPEPDRVEAWPVVDG